MTRALSTKGILPYQQISQLIARGIITGDSPIEARQIQPASLDLRLGKKAYRLISSFLPELSPISSRLDVLDFYQSDLVMYEMDLSQGAILEKGHVYLVPLLEHLHLPATLHARANPKSTTGRLDVFTRVVTDLTAGFDEIRPGYCGPLYLEVVPRSFAIKVKTGHSLNQIRFVRGDAAVSDRALQKVHAADPLLFHNATPPKPLRPSEFRTDRGLFLRIDLTGSDRRDAVIGYRAKKNSHVIDLSKIGHYAARDFWEPLTRHRHDSLLLEPEEFYILASKERIRVPPGYAAEMVAYEAACGELRTHYAGFFDPGFGYGDGKMRGTQVVLEVRPHDVPFLIHDGQTFFKVVYDRMVEVPTELYGATLGSSYQRQALTLSKHFKA
ncbi:MAG: Deoxycytidine triphosphate deaminase [Nitrospirae bacterium]|nr:MAG: 2'-deoxycytidine 5'-triphosphate deaminase [Nitrospira sp. OLB3]MBV6471536.1 Deoxycytidine triphosphate deaminase [Nitrospirota bacterium]MCE7966183.1 2'-deoxycytidine 5'-triphosphate deaminase [Nitrospira sp. NTP2]MCK6492092.1 2'-deoxycytidine 5'-triphosphate deaminase [Nitrospira sp.]MEB2339215.1 2'-deoxycytidine 5'-triphosphate deaminase [Nitrospirales bacterium]